MSLDRKLLEMLVCPKCRGGIQLVDNGRGLLCGACQLKYPVRLDVPIMIAEEAENLAKSSGKVGSLSPSAFFRIMLGPDAGRKFLIESGKCCGIGRSSTNIDKTSVFAVDFTLSLDDNTKRLILNYIGQQFKKMRKDDQKEKGDREFGGFKRASDIILSDPNLSRLHAMIFYDGERVGILDLVSKNGTYVNGREIESQILGIGDIVEMGETKIIREER